MELWIRSQDKEKLVKANDIAIEMNMIYGYFDKNTEYEHLGSYATKERALDVLDEIQNFMLCNREYGYTANVYINELAKCYIYEMPKE